MKKNYYLPLLLSLPLMGAINCEASAFEGLSEAPISIKSSQALKFIGEFELFSDNDHIRLLIQHSKPEDCRLVDQEIAVVPHSTWDYSTVIPYLASKIPSIVNTPLSLEHPKIIYATLAQLSQDPYTMKRFSLFATDQLMPDDKITLKFFHILCEPLVFSMNPAQLLETKYIQVSVNAGNLQAKVVTPCSDNIPLGGQAPYYSYIITTPYSGRNFSFPWQTLFPNGGHGSFRSQENLKEQLQINEVNDAEQERQNIRRNQLQAQDISFSYVPGTFSIPDRTYQNPKPLFASSTPYVIQGTAFADIDIR